MKLAAALFGVSFCLCCSAFAQERPWQQQAWSVETGLLWEKGINTPLAYRLVPTQFSWRSREALGWDLPDGGRFVIRHRLTLFGTWIEQGPESHYIAFDGSPSLELWNARGNWALVGGAGGGLGWLDSRGVPGGQGQDFTFNFFGRCLVEHVTTSGLHITGGFMFQHMSNGGQTRPNPGIDSYGFTFGASWPVRRGSLSSTP